MHRAWRLVGCPVSSCLHGPVTGSLPCRPICVDGLPQPVKRLPNCVDNQQHGHSTTYARPRRTIGGARGYVDNWLYVAHDLDLLSASHLILVASRNLLLYNRFQPASGIDRPRYSRSNAIGYKPLGQTRVRREQDTRGQARGRPQFLQHFYALFTESLRLPLLRPVHFPACPPRADTHHDRAGAPI